MLPVPPSPPAAARPGRHPASPAVGIGIATIVMLDSVGQILWKQAAGALPDSNDPRVLLTAALGLPLAWGLLGLLLTQLVIWLRVLRRADLSFAQPLTSLSYVGVALLSWAYLGERWGWRASLSVLLILCGVFLVSRSQSEPAPTPTPMPKPKSNGGTG